MIQPIQRMTDVAHVRRTDPLAFSALPTWYPFEDDPLSPLLLGIGSLGHLVRSAPEDTGRLAQVGADAYLLVALLTAGRSVPPVTEAHVVALGIEQIERYTSSPYGERWRHRAPLQHLMRAFDHWTAVAPVLSIESGERPQGVTGMQLADLANYLMFFLATSGALERLPIPAAAAG